MPTNNIKYPTTKDGLTKTILELVNAVNLLKDDVDRLDPTFELLSAIINQSDDFNDFQYKYSKFINIKNKKNENSMMKYLRDILNLDVTIRNGNKVIIKKNGRKGVIIHNENNETMGKVSVKLNNGTIEKFREKNVKKNSNV